MKDCQQWSCSVQILNSSAYRKFQHASLYNPLKNTTFTIQKKICKQNFDPFFKNKNKYKLPEMSSNLTRTKLLFNNSLYKLNTNLSIKASGHRGNIDDNNTIINKTSFYATELSPQRNIGKNKQQILNKNLQQTCYKSRYTLPIKCKNKNYAKNSQLGNNTFYDCTRQDKIKTDTQERQQQYIINFKKSVLKVFGAFTEKDQYFSYIFNILQLFYTKIQVSQSKKVTIFSLLEDFELLTSIIYANCDESPQDVSTAELNASESHQDLSKHTIKKEKKSEKLNFTMDFNKNISVVKIIKNMQQFKKSSRNFKIKCPQVRILFHIFLAQLEYYENHLQKCLSQFQFCQYYCRKQSGLETLILCFLWEVLNINISLYKYEDADINLRNLLEMAVVCRNKSSVKYILEKISLLYYYRGNSIMGQYYLKKSQEGLTRFQIQMYLKQYNNNDQIKRLENLLFNCPIQNIVVKRKNNPKLESDIWRESKQQFQKKMNFYMENVNKMLKDHQNAQEGRKIKKIVKKVNCLGQFKKIQQNKTNQMELWPLRNSAFLQKQHKNTQNNQKQSIQKFRKEQEKRKQLTKFYQHPQDNVTKIIKTHLSFNRENKNHNINKIRQQRWRNFLKFLLIMQQQLRQMNHQFIKLENKQD